ncbi:MAG: prepilin-type N-terminal cleavage/methylation domain-containing protein [Marinobacterium sp.]
MNIRKQERGVTLLELVVVMSVLSLLLVLGWRFAGLVDERQRHLAAPAVLDKVAAALDSFAAIHSRLPCPDRNRDGVEDCATGGATGMLPWKTIQISGAHMQRINYGVFRGAGMDLTLAEDRFQPLLPQGISPVILERSLGHVTRLDLCHALQRAEAATPHRGNLHLLDENNVPLHNLAYSLSIPGDTTGAAGAELAPAIPRAYADAGWVRAVEFSQVFTRLHCTGALVASGHAHANAAVSASVIAQGGQEYARLLELVRGLAAAKFRSAEAAVATSVAAVASGATDMSTAIAKSLLEIVTAAKNIPPAAVSVAAASAATASASTALTFAKDTKDEADKIAGDYVTELTRLLTTSQSVIDNAWAADAFELH